MRRRSKAWEALRVDANSFCDYFGVRSEAECEQNIPKAYRICKIRILPPPHVENTTRKRRYFLTHLVLRIVNTSILPCGYVSFIPVALHTGIQDFYLTEIFFIIII